MPKKFPEKLPEKSSNDENNSAKLPIDLSSKQDKLEVKTDVTSSSKITPKSPNKPSFGVADLIAPSAPKSSEFKPKEVSKFSIASMCQSDSKLVQNANSAIETTNGDASKKRPLETTDEQMSEQKKAKLDDKAEESKSPIGKRDF